MFKLFVLLTLSTSVLACSRLIANGSPSPLPTPVMLSTFVSIKRASLVAREETLPPLGTNVKPDRPIHSAAVFIELENLQEADSIVRIQKIEIKNSENGRVELLNQKPEEILLRSLQSSVRDFHLTQAGTYSGVGKVKAVVTLQVNNKTQVIESDAVEVQRY
ncbi:hypothetical protein JOY44_08170 [Phormidium sp. CLA17]|uniref:hypothetical protein n=1 Tax=Leptolyngbya sp. Cla-17 TaxID=2803751 RepID=UPI0014926C1D|nr:hypothetical protein [Leptolyngbya sp. Cla-17]MBM0741590.1 hypothetical protein [Leptolyngbya sp. Cla-17]